MKRLFAAAALLAIASSFAGAQTLEQYLAMRRSLKITQAVGIEALESVVGSRTMEVKGSVCGSIGIGGRTIVLVQGSDGQHLEVESPKPVEWLQGGEIKARLMIKATRANENSSLKAELIGVAPENDVARVEALAAKTAAKTNPAKYTPRTTNSNNPLRGPIGKGGTASRAGTAPRVWNVSAQEALPIYAGFIKNYNKRLSDQEATKIAHGIIGYSIQYGVDARLIMAMVITESGFNPSARSSAGAMGLGQLMPGTAGGMGISNAYDTYQNLYGTVRVIRGHLERYTKKTGDSWEGFVLALAAYNAGSGNVRKHGGVPPFKQTQDYIKKVVSTYQRLSGG